MSSLLIKNGKVVTATDQFDGDVFVQGEKIAAVGANLDHYRTEASEVLDAGGCYILPGGIDPHTHMELPFMGTKASDTFESGTLAGLHGGTTSIIDFAIQTQGDTLHAAFNEWMEKASGNAVGDFSFHVAVTDFNKKTKGEIESLVEKQGVTSFKTFMAYKGALMIDDRQMIDLMREAARCGAMVTTHAENGDILDELTTKHLAEGKTAPVYHALSHPELAEAEASGRFMDLAQQCNDLTGANHPVYIVHMTCEGALNRVREALKRNQKVYAETCIQYLLLDDSLYTPEGDPFGGAKVVMSPPLRKKKDQEALWSGIQQNLVQTVATDHCPFCMDQKRMGENDFSKIPNGAPGVEHRVELLYSEGVRKGRLSMNEFVNATSTQAAKIFGLFPQKGTIAVGSDADLVLFDPNAEHTISAKTHHMSVDYSAYEGWKVTGKARTTILRGKVAIDDGKAKLGKGFGKYLPRQKVRTY